MLVVEYVENRQKNNSVPLREKTFLHALPQPLTTAYKIRWIINRLSCSRNLGAIVEGL